MKEKTKLVLNVVVCRILFVLNYIFCVAYLVKFLDIIINRTGGSWVLALVMWLVWVLSYMLSIYNLDYSKEKLKYYNEEN